MADLQRNRPLAKVGRERRRAPRVKTNLPARWEGSLDQQEACVTSLSRLGCFLLSGGNVEQKELIHLEIDVPNAEPINLSGKVVDKADEIGFALQFIPPEKPDRVRLRQFLAPLHRAAKQKADG